MPNVKELYRVKVFFEDSPSEFKFRPVLVVDADPNLGLYTIVEITSSPPKSPPSYYDQFKEPVYNWRKTGLTQPSFVKTHKIYRVKEDKLLEFIGEIPGPDFNRIIARIIDANS